MTRYDDADWRHALSVCWMIVIACLFGLWQDSGTAGLWLFVLAIWFRFGS